MKIKKIMAAMLALMIVAVSVPAISADAADEYVYGTLSYLTYGEYFSSEFGTNSGVAGEYDTVTSATTNKSKQYVNSYFTEDSGKVTISGIKNVPVRINKTVYDSAVAGTDYAQVKSLLDRGFTASAAELSVYKEIASDGTIGQYQGLVNTDVASDAKSLISTDTPWGNYVLEIYPNDGSDVGSGKDIEGAYVTTTDNLNYPLYHSANLWFKGYEFAWTVESDFTEPHGNKPYTASLTGLTGKNIKSVTYIYKTTDANGVATYNKKTYNVGSLKVKQLLSSDQGATATEANSSNGNASTITLNVPSGTNYSVTSIDGLTQGTDYTVASTTGGVKITYVSSVKPGSYTVKMVDGTDTYEDIKVESVVSANVSEGDISIADNALVINNDSVVLADFLSALSKATLTIDGQTINNGASVMFNEDGTVNLDAKTKGKHSTTLFPEDKTYEVSLSVPGYGVVSGAVVKPFTASNSDNTTTYTLGNNTATDAGNSTNVDPTNTTVNAKKAGAAPKTSDSSALYMVISIAILAAGILLVYSNRRKKA
ncbi:MAG: hypothetical protein K6B67_01520 [Lachnospiraceae bacterium]|nr:hypothetical protein [Lachnospiraceae bacterium]